MGLCLVAALFYLSVCLIFTPLLMVHHLVFKSGGIAYDRARMGKSSSWKCSQVQYN